MEKDYYLNAHRQLESGIMQQQQQQQQQWSSFSLLPQEFLNSHWVDDNKQIDHYFTTQSTVVQSSSSSAVPTISSSSLNHNNDIVGIREFVPNSGQIRDSGRNPPPFEQTNNNNNNNNNNNVCRVNLPNSLVLNHHHPLPALSTDPDFADRAAKFSCFGSRSFNASRTTTTINDVDIPLRSAAVSSSTSSAMARVRSSPSLKQTGSPVDNSCHQKSQLDRLPSFNQNSNDSSSVSGHGETAVSKVDMHSSRKRKTIPKSKTKEDDSHKDEGNYEKRAKTAEASPSENGSIGEEEKAKNGADEALDEEQKPDIKMAQKPTEPPKDYIHVRARRGQATDSHSLAERVRREKIGERMKLLQDLVPGCNKVTGKALMLDEIINYVQSLQCQVEFLSMKLASVDPRQEVNVDNFSSKDVMQRSGSLPQSFYPGDSSVQGLYGHQPKQYPQMHTDRQSPVEPMHNKTMPHNLELQLPLVNEFTDCLPQFPPFSEEDLHSIVGMGFAPNGQMEADFMQ